MIASQWIMMSLRNEHEFVTHKNVYAENKDIFIPVHTRAKIDVLVVDHNN